MEKSGERCGEYYECTKSLYQGSLDSRPNQRYYIECPDHSFIIPPGNVYPEEVVDAAYIKPINNQDKCWRWSWESYLKQKDLLVFKKVKKPTLVNEFGEASFWNVYTKRYQKDAEEKGKVPPNYIDDCINSLGTNRLGDLSIDFSFSKPCELIIKLIQYTNKKNDIYVLDFFAGSGTTLDAIMQLNAEDGGHRKCILVTNNENNICEEVTYERNKRVIQGYTTPKGEEVEGLHNNTLRYYRTNFLSRDKSVKNMRQLVRLATDMLCIKNDVYTEAEFCGKKINPNIARYFDNGQGNRMLVIYEERAIQLLVQLMAQTEDDGIKTMVYVFSPGADPYTDDFEDIAERVKLCALPSAIYEAYKRVLPKRKPKFLDEALQEMKTQAEAEANMQQTLDFGENDNMNEEGGEA